MPELVLLVAAVFVAANIYKPMAPFRSRRDAVIYGLPAVAALAALFSLQPPPPPPPQFDQQPAAAQPPLSPQQEQMRLNKLRGRDENALDTQLRDAARQQKAQDGQ